MQFVAHVPDTHHAGHLEEAARVLRLPIGESGLHWHPFGVYAIPLARRTVGDTQWARRLHIWHPDAEPVGPRSPYGVHTHSGTARSNVLVGSLEHHLYDFDRVAGGVWQERSPEGEWAAELLGHVHATTRAGTTHVLPAHQPHGVGRHGWAVSLFEQAVEARSRPFTTWQRTDGPLEPLQMAPPVDVAQVQRDARIHVEQALHQCVTST